MTLTGDVALDSPVSISSETTIEFGNYDITGSLSSALFVVNGVRLTLRGGTNGTIQNTKWIAEVTNGGRVTIDGGSYETNDKGFKVEGEGSTIIISSGHITTTGTAIEVSSEAVVEMNGGIIEVTDGCGIATDSESGNGGSTITINDGTINASANAEGYESCCVYIANDDTLVVNDGDITATDGAAVCMRGGNVTVHGGNITATGTAGTTGKIEDASFEMTKSALIFHESANYSGNTDMSLAIDGGVLTGVDHSVEILSESLEPNVTVTGGAFIPAYT